MIMPRQQLVDPVDFVLVDADVSPLAHPFGIRVNGY